MDSLNWINPAYAPTRYRAYKQRAAFVSFELAVWRRVKSHCLQRAHEIPVVIPVFSACRHRTHEPHLPPGPCDTILATAVIDGDYVIPQVAPDRSYQLPPALAARACCDPLARRRNELRPFDPADRHH